MALNEKEYLRLRAQIEAEYQTKLSALNTVWRMAKKGAPPRHKRVVRPDADGERQPLLIHETQQEVREPSGQQYGRGQLLKAVKGVVDSMAHGDFNVLQIRDLLAHADRENGDAKIPSISHALRRLEGRGVIELVKKGEGRRPTLYRKAK